MDKNSEQQDRFLEALCACSEALSALAEKLEAEGRSWDALTDAERREVEAIGGRVETFGCQLEECVKERRLVDGPVVPFARGIRV